MENKNLLSRMMALSAIASSEPYKLALTTVRVRVNPERRELTLVVTDGHRLIEETVEHATLPELLGKGELQFSKDLVPFAKMLLKECKYRDCDIKLDGSIGLIFSHSNSPLTLNVKFSDSEFPDYKRVMPDIKLDDTGIKIAFNAKYLFELSKALHNADSKSDIITITIDSTQKLAPIVVRNGNTRARGVLMPCRV